MPQENIQTSVVICQDTVNIGRLIPSVHPDNYGYRKWYVAMVVKTPDAYFKPGNLWIGTLTPIPIDAFTSKITDTKTQSIYHANAKSLTAFITEASSEDYIVRLSANCPLDVEIFIKANKKEEDVIVDPLIDDRDESRKSYGICDATCNPLPLALSSTGIVTFQEAQYHFKNGGYDPSAVLQPTSMDLFSGYKRYKV